MIWNWQTPTLFENNNNNIHRQFELSNVRQVRKFVWMNVNAVVDCIPTDACNSKFKISERRSEGPDIPRETQQFDVFHSILFTTEYSFHNFSIKSVYWKRTNEWTNKEKQNDGWLTCDQMHSNVSQHPPSTTISFKFALQTIIIRIELLLGFCLYKYTPLFCKML